MGTVCSNQKRNEQIVLQVTVYIWKEKEKKYHLFDYQSHESFQQQLQLQSDMKICKYGENILAVQPKQFIEGAQDLFLIQNKILKPIAEIWSIIRQDQVLGIQVLNRVKLEAGQIIRLGRVKIVLWEASFEQALATDESEKDQEFEQQSIDESEIKNCENACRICMSKVATIQNPLLSPCQCSGSVKYIHLKCLQQWLHNKIKQKELNSITLYYWSNLMCEICKDNYKLDFKFQDRKYHLIDIPRPKDGYLMFQISHIDKNKESGLYVIGMQGRSNVKIGRVQDNDIKLQDITVSRNHAKITFNKEEKCIYLEDQGSKFGTLLQIDELNVETKSVIQVANSLFLFDYQKRQVKNYELPQFYKVIEKDENYKMEHHEVHEDDVLINVDYNNQYLSGGDNDYHLENDH